MSRAQHPALGLGAGAVGVRVVELDIGIGIVVERPAGLGVEAGRPVHLVGVLLAGDERAVDAVERVEIAVARRMDDELAVFAVDLRIDDRVLVDFVEVVRIVRGGRGELTVLSGGTCRHAAGERYKDASGKEQSKNQSDSWSTAR